MKAQLLVIVAGWTLVLTAQDIAPVTSIPTWIMQLAGGGVASVVVYRFLFYELPAWRKQSSDALEIVRVQAKDSRIHVEQLVKDFTAALESERTFHQEATTRNIEAMKQAVIAGMRAVAEEARPAS